MTIEGYESRIGELSVRAISRGEVKFDQVDAELGVAHRHLARIRAGVLTLTPGVIREIEQSFARAEKALL